MNEKRKERLTFDGCLPRDDDDEDKVESNTSNKRGDSTKRR